MNFSTTRQELTANGFRPDFRSSDQLLVETGRCSCGQRTVYYGFSNAAEYQAFGVCAACDCVVWRWKEDASTTVGDLFGYVRPEKPQEKATI